jgi:hypothetical protein
VLSFSGPWLSLVENDNPSDRREIQMKRTLSFGFMALMVAAVILYAAKPASAQVTCTKVIPANCTPVLVLGTSSWPYGGYTQYCGGATLSDGANMATVLRTILLNDRPSGSATNEAGYILSRYPSSVGTGAGFRVFCTSGRIFKC